MSPGRVRKPHWPASLALCVLIQPQACTLTAQGAKPAPTPCPHIPPPQPAKPPPHSAWEGAQILAPGHWEWNDGNYVWSKPVWQAPPSFTPAHWQAGFWEANGGACVWHNGHFAAGPTPHPAAATLVKGKK